MEYEYRKFNIIYDVQKDSHQPLYEATGYASCLANSNSDRTLKKFHTTFSTLKGAEHEIKKIIENYIDFEWMEQEINKSS